MLGLVGWMFCIGSVLAIVLGAIARNQIKASGGQVGGDGLAKAGIILGCVGVGLILVYVIAAVSLGTAR